VSIRSGFKKLFVASLFLATFSATAGCTNPLGFDRIECPLPDVLNAEQFTEIITSKLVASGTKGGTNLFELKYFDRVAYLEQSPQFFERVYETGHVYRAEPHATSRHLTEYYSLDVEFGFIDGPEDVIQLERELLTHIFNTLNTEMAETLASYRADPCLRCSRFRAGSSPIAWSGCALTSIPTT
jgi:aspartyl/asparaginyl-tRNA synthetase